MQGSELVALFGVTLIIGAAVFAMLANVALTEGRRRLGRLTRELTELRNELDDRQKIRERNEALMQGALDQIKDLELALESAQAEQKAMEARPLTRIFALSRRSDGSLPLYMAPVTAPSGFPDGAGTGTAQERIYAGPAPDEAGFRAELEERFPADQGYVLGATTLLAPPESLSAAAARQVA